jgi:hypothetical protein
MAEVDTSSYPKPATRTNQSFAQKVNDLAGMEKNIIGVDQAKLNMVTAQTKIMIDEMSALLSEPDLTPEKVIEKAHYFGKQYGLPPQVVNTFISQVPRDPKMLPQFMRTTIRRAQSIEDRLKQTYGASGLYSDNQTDTPVVTSNEPGFGGMRAVGKPIQRQLPITQPTYDESGTPRVLGPQAPVTVPGGGVGGPAPMVRSPMGVPLPVEPPSTIPPGPIPGAVGMTTPDGGKVISAVAEPPTFNNRFIQSYKPTGPVTGMEPLYTSGQQQFTKDQDEAVATLQAVKPLEQAVKLLRNNTIATGPGTAPWTNVVAFLKAQGVININENDPTAVYQELNKKLAQYVANRGNRSDADLANREASSPSAKTQIVPAIMKIAKDQIALDRVQAARALSFETDKRNKDFVKYGDYRGNFPKSVDERAFSLDLMPRAERDKFLSEMNEKYKKGTAEGKKFYRSLQIANKLYFPDGFDD